MLAQQIVAMCAMDDWAVDDLEPLVRRAAPFAALPRVGAATPVLDMLAGRYPSDEFAELRPRIVWDRVTGTLTGRPGAQRLAVTSGGTIPDRGLFGVFLATGEGTGRRVGELDEEMVYESRVGDVFTLGTVVLADRGHHPRPGAGHPGARASPAGCRSGRATRSGRPAELGRAVGAFVRELGRAAGRRGARPRLRAAGLDEWAADNLLAYLDEQREATGHVPDDRTIVVERFRDELGDWRRGRALALRRAGARARGRWPSAPGCASGTAWTCRRCTPTTASCCGCPTSSRRRPRRRGRAARPGRRSTPTRSHDLVTTEVGGSALFAARFRECAARALLLPRRDPDRRQPLWQQRQRAAQLLEVARKYARFPIVLEAVRECLQDVFDVPGAGRADARHRLARGAASSRSRRRSRRRSPARLLFGYVARSCTRATPRWPSAGPPRCRWTRRLLAELLGRGDALRELLDPEVLDRAPRRELQRLDARAARSATPRASPTCCGCSARCRTGDRAAAASRRAADESADWLAELERRPPA